MTMNPTNENTLAALAGKYLTFRLGDESYGISVLKVREIIRQTKATAVPQMPDYIKGVINLRGKIIPVMDLRLKLGLPVTEVTEHTCIVVVQVKLADGQNTALGLVVDGVEEVTNIAASDIEETPDFGAKIATRCILGMAKLKGAVKALLDINSILETGAAEQIAILS
jgi:purine-binding chemotaxis protein CheW